MRVGAGSLLLLNHPRLVLASILGIVAIALVLPRLSGDLPIASMASDSTTSLSVPFIANEGQIDPDVAFYARTFAGDVFVTVDGTLVYNLPMLNPDNSPPGMRWTITETWVGGQPQVVAEHRSKTGVSFFQGSDPAAWRSDVATYDVVGLGEVWPGVGIRLSAHGNNIEKVLEVAPGADVADIRIRIDGATALSVPQDGSLIAATEVGNLHFSTPKAWQELNSKKVAVEVAYAVDGYDYGFMLGDYDPAFPVVIDPLLQSTYLGSGDWPEENAVIAPHPLNSDVYVAYHQLFDSTITRLSVDLGTVVSSFRFAGDISFTNDVLAIAVHPGAGDLYVAGVTNAPTFTGSAGGLQPAPASAASDGFVIRFAQDLGAVIQSTYLGGSGPDELEDMIISDAGVVYVSGTTTSSDFPGTAGGAIPTNPAARNGFVASLSGDLTVLNQATYLGGSGNEEDHALTSNSVLDVIYVAGRTTSLDIPGTVGGAQPAIAGAQDIYIAQLSSDLTTLEQSTYHGGTGQDVGAQLAIDPSSGQVFVAGLTTSTDFPGTAGGAQPALATDGFFATDVFVARLTADLSTLNQATYLGGPGSAELSPGLAVHPTTGDVYVVGTWGSDTADFPGTAGGAQPDPGGDRDAFAARLSGDLTTLLQATYLGGSRAEFIFDLVEPINVKVHPLTGEVYVAGITASADFPATTGGAVPTAPGGVGADNVFIARFGGTLAGAPSPDTTPDPFMFIDQTGVPLDTLIVSNTVSITGITASAAISITGGEYSVDGAAFTNAAATVDNGAMVSVRVLSSSLPLTTTSTTLTVGGVSDTFDVTTLLPPPDTTPDSFTFIDQTDVPLDTLITSNSVTITGIDEPVPISITGGEYSIDGGAFTSSSGMVDSDSMVVVRVLSSSEEGTTTSATLTAGTISDSFDVTTLVTAIDRQFRGKGTGALGIIELLVIGIVVGFLRLVGERRRAVNSSLLLTVAACALFITAPPAASAEGTYIGVSIGASQGDYDAGDLRAALEPPYTVGTISVDDSDTGVKIFAGYIFDQNLAFEAAYVDLGEIDSEFRVVFPPSDLDDVLDDSSRKHGFLATGVAVSGVWTYKINRHFSIFGKAGLFIWEAEIGVEETASGERIDITDEGVNPMAGIGLRYNPNDQWGGRMEWERYQTDDWVDFISIGVERRF